MRARALLYVIVLLVLVALACTAQDAPSNERSYPFPAVNVKAALEKMGAYQGARLPSLDGFIVPTRNALEHYERAYYEYKIELEPRGDDQTVVRVKAHVSAWFDDPTGVKAGYQDFESNGRLESDVLDRLAEFLAKNRSTAGADAESLQKEIDDVQQQRREIEGHISELEKQLKDSPKPHPHAEDPEFVSVSRPHASVLKAPQAGATVLMRAMAEDEFELLERRGVWLRVQLEDNRSGWLRSADARLLDSSDTGPPQEKAKTSPDGGFTEVRELVSSFAGDWAPLKGKQALYIWVRPEGSVLNIQAARKLPFAQSVFMRRYLEGVHSSGDTISGIVVIFLDMAGGVAAATMDDIQRYANGALTSEAFSRRCSLDPPSAFTSSPQASDQSER
jgi:hypothetical protein